MIQIQCGNIKAEFFPDLGMLGASLQYSGSEILRRIENLEDAALRGSTAGIPILYPWANRLSNFEFETLGKKIHLDRSLALLHLDEHGLPLHGVPWSLLKWEVQNQESDQLSAQLSWTTPHLLQIFPFPHRIQMNVVTHQNGLNIETKVTADAHSKVPISFGYHPYIGIPDLNRSQWKLKLPPMKRILLDQQRIATGAMEEFSGLNDQLGEFEFDDGFELLDPHSEFSIEGSTWKISLQLLNGYTHAQIFAPLNKQFIALEPMTAPTNALISGQNLRVLEMNESFSASFNILIERLK